MEAIRPVKVIDVRSNRRQIENGKTYTVAAKKSFMVQPKLQNMIRRTSDLLQAEQYKQRTFNFTKKGLIKSKKTIDLVRDKHLTFLK